MFQPVGYSRLEVIDGSRWLYCAIENAGSGEFTSGFVVITTRAHFKPSWMTLFHDKFSLILYPQWVAAQY